jgi:thiamine-monophosphate kinase
MPEQQGAAASVAALGEFPLIARLAARVPHAPYAPGAPGLYLGIGDDAAVWLPTPRTASVVTADALIEDVHFRRATIRARDLGWKSLAVNLSDIAAMGARPRYAVVTLALPPDTPLAWFDEFHAGLCDAATAHQTLLVGGDLTGGALVAISVTLFGETASLRDGTPPLLRRDAARPGDQVAVTGTLGAAAGGLQLLERAQAAGTDLPALEQRATADEAALLAAHWRPQPRVGPAATLLASGVRCAMDLSDGLLGDARRIAEASGVRIILEAPRLPVAPPLQRRFPNDALLLALGGGEDYELLCTAPPAVLAAASAALAQEHGLALTVVGRVEAAGGTPEVQVLDAAGVPLPLRGGFTHFAPPADGPNRA